MDLEFPEDKTKTRTNVTGSEKVTVRVFMVTLTHP